ncbi:MAG: T9SS type A sorting domain-containing protein, partial [Chlorobi bacterium]|nr:T9SS type A sorting domain-containing protein [Chlorobiota bacterium]
PASQTQTNTFPNPFTNSTTIQYNLDAAAAVTINIYSALGKKIRSLDEGYKNPGRHIAIFEANDLQIGMYYYTISIGNEIESGKMILAR